MRTSKVSHWRIIPETYRFQNSERQNNPIGSVGYSYLVTSTHTVPRFQANYKDWFYKRFITSIKISRPTKHVNDNPRCGEDGNHSKYDDLLINRLLLTEDVHFKAPIENSAHRKSHFKVVTNYLLQWDKNPPHIWFTKVNRITMRGIVDTP